MIKTGIKQVIAQRFMEARIMSNLIQDDAAEKMGFNDRQIISNIESGKRQLSAEELIKACAVFNKNIDFFTDPYVLNEAISWRTSSKSTDLDNFEIYVKKIIAADLHFSELLGEPFDPLNCNLPVSKKSSFESVANMAEIIGEKWGLGDIPSLQLADKAQENLNLDILYLDFPENISEAACQTNKINIILINRNDIYYRRNFDIGHEIFHILTWNSLCPEHIDSLEENSKNRVEQLAEVFTSVLLMPEKTILKLWDEKESNETNKWFFDTAKYFRVSVQALKWRLVNLKKIDKNFELNNNLIYNKENIEDEIPGLFNKNFVRKVFEVLEKGLVSLNKAAEVLNMPAEKLSELFLTYGLKSSYEF